MTGTRARRNEAVAAIRAGRPLGHGRHSVTIHRNLCDMADQWSFADIPAHVTAARENLVFTHADTHPELGIGLSEPLTALRLQLSRPFFFGDTVDLHTTAHQHGDGIGFIHELTGPDGTVHGIVTETFHPTMA